MVLIVPESSTNVFTVAEIRTTPAVYKFRSFEEGSLNYLRTLPSVHDICRSRARLPISKTSCDPSYATMHMIGQWPAVKKQHLWLDVACDPGAVVPVPSRLHMDHGNNRWNLQVNAVDLCYPICDKWLRKKWFLINATLLILLVSVRVKILLLLTVNKTWIILSIQNDSWPLLHKITAISLYFIW